MKTKYIILILIAGAILISIFMSMVGGGDDGYGEESLSPQPLTPAEVFDDSEVFTDEVIPADG